MFDALESDQEFPAWPQSQNLPGPLSDRERDLLPFLNFVLLMQTEPNPIRWTFADLASTYRFWALLGALVFVAFGVTAFWHALQVLPQFNGLRLGASSQILSSLIMGNVAGIALGLLLVRGGGAMGMIAAVTTCAVVYGVVAWYATDIAWWQIRTAVFTGHAVMMSLAFVVPALIAGTTTDRLAFASALGVVTAFQVLNDSTSSFFSVLMLEKLARDYGVFLGAAALIVALILLLATRGILFDEFPPVRHKPLSPVVREGSTVAVLAALPWFSLGGVTWLSAAVSIPLNSILNWSIVAGMVTLAGLIASAYWIYRIHGEVASIYPTQKLFTPWGALLMYILVPMATPILLLTLGGILREASIERGVSMRRSGEWFNGWCVLFPPVAMGMAQEMLNELGATRDVLVVPTKAAGAQA
ncbi:hypothetical protein ACV33W_16915 [Pseudomonas aeruginosa]